MKKVALSLAAIAVVSLAAGDAFARCDFNVGKDAKGGKWSLVRAYAACGGSTQHPATNDVTNTGTPSCEPVLVKVNGDGGTKTDWEFSEKGACGISVKAKGDDACEELTTNDGIPLAMPAGGCVYLQIGVKCKGIVDNDGVTPVEDGDSVWRLLTNTRTTLADQGGDDQTIIDFSLPIVIDTAKKGHKVGKGKVSVKTDSAIELSEFLSPEAAALPTCTNFEIVDIVLEADEQAFARMGSSVKDLEILVR